MSGEGKEKVWELKKQKIVQTMQINGIISGPTMAASEPPEPPPRNPDRINASLHKLSESKNIKSLDSSVSASKDKSVANNKPIKPLLSLDNNNISVITATAAAAATTSSSTLSASSSSSASAAAAAAAAAALATATATPTTTSTIPSAAAAATATTLSSLAVKSSSIGIGNIGGTGGGAAGIVTSAAGVAAAGTSALLYNKRSVNELTPSGDSSSTLSSNGSNHTLTSPMLIDNLQQQQQQQQNMRLAYPANKIDSIGQPAMLQQQNGAQRGQSTAALGEARDAQQTQLFNGAGALLHVSNANSNHLNAQSNDVTNKLREDNERLQTEVLRLRKVLENSSDGAVGGVELSDAFSVSASGSGSEASTLDSVAAQQRIERLETELRSVKNQLLSLRLDRKKLRNDKSELIAQVKQLCASLQEKEQELREFIRNYQERVRETETNNAKLNDDRDRERFKLLKQARDEAERSLALAQQLNARDMQFQRLQEQLQEARRQLTGCMSDQESLLSFAPLTPPSAASGMINQMAVVAVAGAAGGLRSTADDSGRGNSNSLSAFSSSLSGGSGATVGDRNSCSNDSVLRNSSDRESTGGELNFSDGACDNGPCITVDPDSISLVSSQNMYQFGTPKERSPTLSPLNSAAYSRSVEQLGSPVDSDGPCAVLRKFAPKTGTLSARTGRGGTWGSISRVFARSRNKNKALSADGASEYMDYSWSPLSEEGYAEKLRLLREAAQLPMDRWRATQVIAWLEVALGMPQYSLRCAENVKSGKVLLELNDAELEAGLGLIHPMHRKKLRLAIEEQRRPEFVRYPLITQLGHTWVASEWLPDIGLPQYAEPFLQSLVDARMLDTLSKKELEKFLGVTRKFHQASIVHGIHVLRIVKYDRQTLAMRRVQSESVDADPIVWTNQRFIRWVRSIDLGEYADNLKDSGVHGGLVVLEPSFSGDTMATALGIPPSKHIIRRHLSTEFDALILPARATLGQGIRSGCGIVPITGPGGLQHYATTDRRSSGNLRISAWKGSQSSLSKAFRFNAKPHRNAGDRNSFGNSTSPTPSYSSSSEGGGGIYATIGGNAASQQYHFLPPPTTAPPPPPTIYGSGSGIAGAGGSGGGGSGGVGGGGSGNYGPPGHRVSAPPVGALQTSSDSNLLYEQHRRVKSISDIGVTASQSGGSGSLGGVSNSSNSPV